MYSYMYVPTILKLFSYVVYGTFKYSVKLYFRHRNMLLLV